MRLAIIAALLVGCTAPAESPPATDSPAPSEESDLIVTFVGWQAIDDERGYAVFSVHNNGLDEITATCTLTVSGDFGEGSAEMEPVTLLPNQTEHVQVAITADGPMDSGKESGC